MKLKYDEGKGCNILLTVAKCNAEIGSAARLLASTQARAQHVPHARVVAHANLLISLLASDELIEYIFQYNGSS